MKKVLLAIGTLAILQSCGSDETKSTTNDTNVETSNTATTPKEVTNAEAMTFSDAASLQKAEDALRAKFNGKELRVFQNVNFYSDGRISIELQDPNKPENIDHYDFRDGKWSEPQPVQISGDGKMDENTTPLNDIKFANVATIYKNWMEKAKEVEGASEKELTHVYYSLFVPTGKREWRTGDVEGTREKYNISYNADGSIKEFKKK